MKIALLDTETTGAARHDEVIELAFAVITIDPESGRFTVSGTFEDYQLVVMSYSGDAEYRLSVWIDPPTYLQVASAANAVEKMARPIGLRAYATGVALPSEPE